MGKRVPAAPLVAAILALALNILPAAAQPARDQSNWSGFHIGLHVGAFDATTSFSDPDGPALYGGFVETPGFAGGLQLGYDWTIGRSGLLGVEASGSYLSADAHNTCQQATTNFIGSNCRVAP